MPNPLSLEISLLPPVKMANMRNNKPDTNDNERRLYGNGKAADTLETMEFFSHSGGGDYPVTLNIIPENTPLQIFHKNLGYMSLNYKTHHELIERLDHR